jgi:hypothetical protein
MVSTAGAGACGTHAVRDRFATRRRGGDTHLQVARPPA